MKRYKIILKEQFLSAAIDNTVTLDDVPIAGLLRKEAIGHEDIHMTMLLWS